MMLTLPTRIEHGITAVIGLADSDPVLDVIARLALLHPVQVIVGGNRFDAHHLARIIRRHSVQLDLVLERIHQARPFTCFQALKLLEETQPTTPLVAIDLLTTFYDENISDSESVRLVSIAISHLQRLGRQAPVLVTLRPPAALARVGLVQLVQNAADQLYIYEFPQESFQPTLF
jgi:hypothetical protein